MKAFKKVLCITLALMLAGLALMAPVAAATDVPLVVIQGFAAVPLVKNAGTEQELQVFPPENLATDGNVAKLTTALITGFIEYGANGANWDAFGKRVLPIVKDMLADVAYNTDGTPVNDNVTHETYDEPMSSYTEEEKKAIFTPFGLKYAEQYNEDLVYAFGYDWRQSPLDCADQLNNFINYVKARTGSNKVNVVAISQGSAVTLAYLAQYGGSDINNLVFASPAWQGTSLAGDTFTGNIDIDVYTFENFMVGMSDGSATTHIMAVIFSSFATSEEFTEEWFLILEKAIEGMEPRIYSDIIVPMLAGMPGLWSLVPADYYEDAKAFLFPEGVDADLLAKIDRYNEIQRNAKQVIEEAEDTGMKFAIVCGYNRQIAPINDNLNTSDMVVDTKYASGGATCADYLTAFSDWDFGGKGAYKQANPDGHYHISWDYKVDASTCMFPEQTWFIKNLQHVAYGTYEGDGTCDIVMWLLSMDEQHTVFTDKENYPQFSLYNTYKRFTKGINVDTYLGDVNHDYLITTTDAILALKMAAGLMDIPEDEDKQIIIDANEDGEISTDDARYILCWAIGIPTDELY
ncbi:MAG: alpha/beta fold hydrolase [Clostridia bacterium]|nr:alpha/beta fold hydrolase [Clostridia bacterium]